MSYTVTYRGTSGGGSGIYARVKRLSDGKWWSETGSAWVASETSACNKTLTEDGTIKGLYTAASGVTPAPGEIYAIHVYDADGLLMMSEEIYSPTQRTALQIVNEVQKQLRLPQTASASFATDPHAQLILSFANKVMTDMMAEASVLDELKIKGALGTRDGVAIYTLYPVNAANLDTLKSLQVSGYSPLYPLGDADFRAYKRNLYSADGTTNSNQPLVYRTYGRAGNALVIELAPTPDDIYQIDFEGLQKPDSLSAATDIPVLDADTIIAGVMWLARKDQGEDFQADLQAFSVKMGLRSASHSDGDWGDTVEAE